MERQESEYIISYMHLRRLLGLLGMALPIVVASGDIVFGRCGEIQSSISSYYHTAVGSIFVGIISSFSLFLFCYKGPEKLDGVAANIAAILALGVVLFPTALDPSSNCQMQGWYTCEPIHLTCAATFFLVLAYMSAFLFTRSHKDKSRPMTPRKMIRNLIYRTCAVVMVVCLGLIAIWLKVIKPNHAEWNKLHPVFWLETGTLFAFGISWIVKGEFVLKDKSVGQISSI